MCMILPRCASRLRATATRSSKTPRRKAGSTSRWWLASSPSEPRKGRAIRQSLNNQPRTLSLAMSLCCSCYRLPAVCVAATPSTALLCIKTFLIHEEGALSRICPARVCVCIVVTNASHAYVCTCHLASSAVVAVYMLCVLSHPVFSVNCRGCLCSPACNVCPDSCPLVFNTQGRYTVYTINSELPLRSWGGKAI